MKRILSIDWDYFIGATAKQRALLFPDGGNENISYSIQDFIWNSRYANPELKEIGILRDDYQTMLLILEKFAHNHSDSEYPNAKILSCVAVSHRWIYDFIVDRTTEDEEFEVYNVDFHHDMYHYRTQDQEVNCGNWVNCLTEKRPKMKYYWVNREDSEFEVLGGTVDCKTKSLKELLDLDFDYVFICRSDCWSPPHLDKYFDTMLDYVCEHLTVNVEGKVTQCRSVTIPSEIEKEYGDVILAKHLTEEEE